MITHAVSKKTLDSLIQKEINEMLQGGIIWEKRIPDTIEMFYLIKKDLLLTIERAF